VIKDLPVPQVLREMWDLPALLVLGVVMALPEQLVLGVMMVILVLLEQLVLRET